MLINFYQLQNTFPIVIVESVVFITNIKLMLILKNRKKKVGTVLQI